MAFTYQPGCTEPQGRSISDVRRHISDTRAETPIFSDEEILGFLADVSWAGGIEPWAAMMAACFALNANATDEGRLQKRVETLGLKLDGPALTKELRAQANELWTRGLLLRPASAVEAEAESDFDVILNPHCAFEGWY